MSDTFPPEAYERQKEALTRVLSSMSPEERERILAAGTWLLEQMSDRGMLTIPDQNKN